ncbi:MAG: PH domain-containing protein [Saccharofermentanales bacterium]
MENNMENQENSGLEFVRKRGNILILFEKLSQLPLLIGTIIFTIVAGAAMDPQLIIFAVFIAMSPLMQLVKYAFTYYTITDNQLIVESGIWNKKRIEIPLRSITTVDLTQNVLYQIFKTYKIKVDNGSQTKDAVNAAEVKFALKEDLAFLFKQLVENDVSESEDLNSVNENLKTDINSSEPLTTVISNPLDFLQLGLLESKLIYIIGLFPVVSVAAYILGSIGISPSAEEIGKTFENIFTAIPIGLVIFIGIAVLYFGGMVFSIFRTIKTFFGFQISADSKKIYIEYGLLTKRKYTLQKDKISGIVLRQNLLMRFFHKYKVDVLVIGYGDKSDDEVKQQPILFPIANKRKIQEIVEKIMPEFAGNYYEDYTSKESISAGPSTNSRALRYFFYNAGLVFSTLILIGSIILAVIDVQSYYDDIDNIYAVLIMFVPALLLECLVVGSIILQYFNTRMLPGKRITTIQSGGYHRSIVVLKTSCIENITAIASRWKHNKGFASIQLGYIAPLRTSKMVVKNRELVEFETLESVLEM